MIVLDTRTKDDDFDGSRKFAVVTNEDETISLEDQTNYKQKGTEFGALEVNTMNAAIMGFVSSSIAFEDDGSITETDANGRKKKTIFSKSEEGDTEITETLYDTDASVLGTKVSTIARNGKNIEEVASV